MTQETPPIIGFCNQKGGVGKTTSAVNLAAWLAAFGQRTLLVDADSQGSATSGVGVDRNQLKHTLYDALCGEVPTEQAITETKWDNLFLLPAAVSLSGLEVELPQEPGWQLFLQNILQNDCSNFDYIIIDGPPSLGVLQILTLVASRHLIIPVQCEFMALEGLSLLMNTINEIQQSVNPDLEIMGILLTMATHTNLSKQVVDDVRAHFDQQVFQSVIPRNIRISESPSHGMPILHYDPKSQGCRAYLELCKEVVHEFEKARAGAGIERPADTATG